MSHRARTLSLVLASTLASPAALAGGPKLKDPPKLSKAVVYTTLSPEQAKGLAEQVFDTVTASEPEAGANHWLLVEVGDLRARMNLRDEGSGTAEVYWLSAAFSFDTPVTMAVANAWNADRLYSRSYVNPDGEIVLESDLDLAGGVTEERLIDHLRTWRMLLSEFTEHIGFYDPIPDPKPAPAVEPAEAVPAATEPAPTP